MKHTKPKAGRRRPAAKEQRVATEQIHLRLTADLHAYLRETATKDGRTVTGLIIHVCEQYRRSRPLK